MADEFGKLVAGINPTSGSGTTEWFIVPDEHEYQGYVRVAFVGSSGAATSEYSIYGLESSGETPTPETLERKGVLDYGDVDDLTFDLGPGEALSVGSDSANISFNFRGLDIDGS